MLVNVTPALNLEQIKGQKYILQPPPASPVPEKPVKLRLRDNSELLFGGIGAYRDTSHALGLFLS